MKKNILKFVAAITLASVMSAQAANLNLNALRSGVVSNNKHCVTVGPVPAGPSLIVSASNGGLATTYSTNAPNYRSGIYIGAPASGSITTNNTTAPSSGVYRFTFSSPVNSIEMKIDAISDTYTPSETLSEFRTDNGPARVSFKPVGNTATFDSGRQTITANARNGDGVILHRSRHLFSYFEFRHRQHPRNIGFTVHNIKLTTTPFNC